MKFSLDDTDFAILRQMQKDASISNVALAAQVGVSPATCLRRILRLRESGILQAQVAIVDPWALAATTGRTPGLYCIAEVSLDLQGAENLQAFEQLAVARPEVQQCWRVSGGPDFVLIVQTASMADYRLFADALFTRSANVRNVRVFFATGRACFNTVVSLPGAQAAEGAAA